jgi:hypothetical protein
MRICASIGAVGLATACAAHASTPSGTGVATPVGSAAAGGPPISGALGASLNDGPPGTVVTLNAIRCPPQGSKPDEIFWRDSAHPDDKGGVPLTKVVRTGDALQATFVVPSNAPVGNSTFATYCGAKAQEARGLFTVDPP